MSSIPSDLVPPSYNFDWLEISRLEWCLDILFGFQIFHLFTRLPENTGIRRNLVTVLLAVDTAVGCRRLSLSSSISSSPSSILHGSSLNDEVGWRVKMQGVWSEDFVDGNKLWCGRTVYLCWKQYKHSGTLFILVPSTLWIDRQRSTKTTSTSTT